MHKILIIEFLDVSHEYNLQYILQIYNIMNNISFKILVEKINLP